MKKSICVVSNGYPTREESVYAFIQPLVWEIVDAGYDCTVIAPQSTTKSVLQKRKKRKYCWMDETPKGGSVRIFQPSFISLSNLKLWDIKISSCFRDTAIQQCFKKENIHADALYGHFWDCGMAACKVAKERKIPVYVASGESEIRVYDEYRKNTVMQLLPLVKGVICVSTKNLMESAKLELFSCSPKTIVIPNAVNTDKFYPLEQNKARQKLGIDQDENVAIFVGSFSERKGVLRVLEAVERVPNLKLILIGAGEQKPSSKRIIFSGKVSHHEIVTYLNAADVFVLPTLAEGCCNAIVEAMHCGLPIVSSNLPFNKDILNTNNAILVDPMNVGEIADALHNIVYNENVRKKLVCGALQSAQEHVIRKRVQKILGFMEL